jgi:hypothetical protein
MPMSSSPTRTMKPVSQACSLSDPMPLASHWLRPPRAWLARQKASRSRPGDTGNASLKTRGQRQGAHLVHADAVAMASSMVPTLWRLP